MRRCHVQIQAWGFSVWGLYILPLSVLVTNVRLISNSEKPNHMVVCLYMSWKKSMICSHVPCHHQMSAHSHMQPYKDKQYSWRMYHREHFSNSNGPRIWRRTVERGIFKACFIDLTHGHQRSFCPWWRGMWCWNLLKPKFFNFLLVILPSKALQKSSGILMTSF